MSKQPPGIPRDGAVPRYALSRTEAARSIGVSPRSIDALIADRTSGFPIVRIGTRVLVPRTPLEKWLAERVNGSK